MSVRFVYLVPSDRVPRDEYAYSIERAALHVQRWYFEALGTGKTFALHEPVVEVEKTLHPARWYSTNPRPSDRGPGRSPVQREARDRSQWYWENALADGFDLCNAGFDDPKNRWIFFVDAEPEEGQSVGANEGVALLPEHDLVGLVGGSMPGHVKGPCRWVGGLGHELGHALGLPHPPQCEKDGGRPECQCLMYLGYLKYPETFLLPEEKAALARSPFFGSREPIAPAFSCRDLSRPAV